MARPRLGDSESKRLQMVITEDELKAIDDWRFENRIENRSEAIRRLCQIAIYAMGKLDPHAEAYDEYAKKNLQSIEKISGLLRDENVSENIIVAIESELVDQFLRLATLIVEISKVSAVAFSLTENQFNQIAVKTIMDVARENLEKPSVLQNLEDDLLRKLRENREENTK